MDGLNALGYDAYVAPDGESALLMLKRRPLDCALISADLQGMSGNQASRALARIFPSVPVILMCPNPEPSQLAHAFSYGISEVVKESVSAEDMHDIIQNNLKRRESLSKRVLSDHEKVLTKTIRAIAAAVDAKSHHAARHSAVVTQLSLMVAARLGFTQDDTATLEMAAQLHDIGKIGTPDAVLSKPGSLTDEEWVDVLKHPALGCTFLSTVPELAEVANVIRHHHEHYDGTGYPDNLQGDAIPLMSRIIGIVDAYDAMTNERPYRKAMSQDHAIAELKLHSGKQFDPVIVEHFLSIIDEMVHGKRAA